MTNRTKRIVNDILLTSLLAGASCAQNSPPEPTPLVSSFADKVSNPPSNSAWNSGLTISDEILKQITIPENPTKAALYATSNALLEEVRKQVRPGNQAEAFFKALDDKMDAHVELYNGNQVAILTASPAIGAQIVRIPGAAVFTVDPERKILTYKANSYFNLKAFSYPPQTDTDEKKSRRERNIVASVAEVSTLIQAGFKVEGLSADGPAPGVARR